MPDLVEQGLAAYRAAAWGEAFERLSEADGRQALDGHGLDRLAEVAYLSGQGDPGRAWERAHAAHLRAGDCDRAARSAFWLGLYLLLRGETAPATGWLARAGTILDDAGLDCGARGYLLVPAALEALASGEPGKAEALSSEAAAIGQRFGDADLWALGWLGRGEALIASGHVPRGMVLLDEVMVSVTAGEVSPIPTGIVYCAVIEACIHGYDMKRAAQWTEALARWCDDQPELVPYRGQCLVHRAQVFHARGEWERAVSEASGADRLLSHPPHPARALALYVLGDLHRLRGTFDAAEAAYRQAGQLGFQPLPGLPLLRLAQGRTDAALAGMRRALEETADPLVRPALLAAAVEILSAAGDHDSASAAVDELEHLVIDQSPGVLRAMANHARGTAALAAGDARAAIPALRRACALWHELDMPYECARARVAIAAAYRALGDADGADTELDGARVLFERLGAAPDLAGLARAAGPAVVGEMPLSARECDVLKLVAAGDTNKEIGAALGISEHTVARHLQNIFTKIGVSSRAAAVAEALERGLV